MVNSYSGHFVQFWSLRTLFRWMDGVRLDGARPAGCINGWVYGSLIQTLDSEKSVSYDWKFFYSTLRLENDILYGIFRYRNDSLSDICLCIVM